MKGFEKEVETPDSKMKEVGATWAILRAENERLETLRSDLEQKYEYQSFK